MSFQHIGIVGAGSWGTALAVLAHENGVPVTVWGHNAKHIADVAAARENTAYLPGVALPESLRFTPDLDALAACDLILFVTPSKAVREVAARLTTTAVKRDAVLL